MASGPLQRAFEIVAKCRNRQSNARIVLARDDRRRFDDAQERSEFAARIVAKLVQLFDRVASGGFRRSGVAASIEVFPQREDLSAAPRIVVEGFEPSIALVSRKREIGEIAPVVRADRMGDGE